MLENVMRTETQSLDTLKRQGMYTAISLDELRETTAFDPGTTQEMLFEIEDFIDKSSLSDVEKQYCRLVIAESQGTKNSDISRMMGVSRMTITYIKQRIKDKIGNSLYN
jgi:DNA-binding CsgD family transcriptional regulator